MSSPTKPGLNRYLRVTPGGLLRTDAARRSRPRRTSTASTCCAPPTRNLTAEDIALGYKQLLEVERGWRDMKQVIDLRPVYHRKEERIRAHVILCWLALLLIRIAETTAGDTWPDCAANWTGSPSAPSPARPAPSASAPSSPRPSATSSPSSKSTRPRGSSSSPPQTPDQAEHHHPDTRPRSRRACIFPHVSTGFARLSRYISCGTQVSIPASFTSTNDPRELASGEEAAGYCRIWPCLPIKAPAALARSVSGPPGSLLARPR